MVPIDRLTLVKALNFLHVTQQIREAYKPGMTASELSRMLESYRIDLSDWPFTDLSELGVESEASEIASVNDFDRSFCLIEGIKKLLDSDVTDPTEWIRSVIQCHPETVYGPPMAVVRNGTAQQMAVPALALRKGKADDAKKDV